MRFFEAGGQQNGMQKAVGYCNNLIIQCFLPRCLLITDQQHHFPVAIRPVSIAIRPAGFGGQDVPAGMMIERDSAGRIQRSRIHISIRRERSQSGQAALCRWENRTLIPLPPLPPLDRVESHLLELLGLATRPFLLRMQESSAFLMVLCACRTVVHASSIWRAAMRLKKLIDKRVFPV